MYRRIILTDDGSPLARSAATHAAMIASAGGSEILVIRASHAAGMAAGDLAPEDWDRCLTPEAVAKAASEPLEAEPHRSGLVESLRAQGVERAGSLVVHVDDEVGEALEQAAEALAADLVVMASAGETGLRRNVLGSVADHLVRHLGNIPLLVCPAKEEASADYRRIMVTLDGSDTAQHALPHAEHLATLLKTDLLLLSVRDTSDDPAPFLEGVARLVAERVSVPVRTHVEDDDDDSVAESILDAVDDEDVDLLVMATHGRGGLGRLLLGSIADAVTRGIEDVPVLLVRPTEA